MSVGKLLLVKYRSGRALEMNLLMCACILASTFSSAAAETPTDSSGAPVSPEIQLIDSYQVDMFADTVRFRANLGTIGSDIGALSFQPVLFSLGGGADFDYGTDSNDWLSRYLEELGLYVAMDVYHKGISQQFRLDSPLHYINASGPYVTAVEAADASTITLTMRNGEARIYNKTSTNPCKKNSSQEPNALCYFFLHAIIKPNGLVETHTWTFNGDYVRPSAIYNNMGREVRFTYASDTPGSGSWVSLTQALLYDHSFSNNPLRTISISHSGNSTIYRAADSAVWKVEQINGGYNLTLPNGRVIKYKGGDAALSVETDGVTRRYSNTYPDAGEGQTTITAEDGTIFKFKYIAHSSKKGRFTYLTGYQDQLGRNYAYEMRGDSLPQKITGPSGNMTKYDYDNRGNILKETRFPNSGIDISSVSQSWTYAADCANAKTCNSPLSFVNEKGAQTDYAYHPESGQLASYIGPAPTAGAPRPITLFKYDQFAANILDASGALQPSTTKVWLMTSKIECQAAASSNTPVCDAAKPLVTTSYKYGGVSSAANLLLREIDVTTNGDVVRQCFVYNQFGDRTSITHSDGATSGCP